MDTRTYISNPSAVRGALKAEREGEYVFNDTEDYTSYVAGQVRASSMKFKMIASGNMSPTTVSNMASGKTRYPRFSTIAGIIGALGQEVVIRPVKRQQ